MGLNVRLSNIVSNNSYTVEYSVLGYNDNYITVGSYGSNIHSILIPNLDFSTKYFVKITDNVTNQYIIQTITTYDEDCLTCGETNFLLQETNYTLDQEDHYKILIT